jgi:hypothetical protein
MASGNFVLDKGFTPAAPIARYRAVKLTGNPQEVTQVAASTDIVLGVAQFAVMASEIPRGKQASVRLIGITPWECSEVITVGQQVECDADGRCSVADEATNPAGLCVGDTSTAAGDRVTVLLYNNGSKAVTS